MTIEEILQSGHAILVSKIEDGRILTQKGGDAYVWHRSESGKWAEAARVASDLQHIINAGIAAFNTREIGQAWDWAVSAAPTPCPTP